MKNSEGIGIRLTSAERDRVERACIEQDCSINALVRTAIRRYLDDLSAAAPDETAAATADKRSTWRVKTS